MADERCEWLDKDTAERLLRGGPVGAVDDHARAQAARLHAVLDGAARSAARSEIGELPGEKAALEAFRLARDGFADPVGTARPTARAAAAGRWHRPVRFSIAAVVAGCALSGVAVAAGTGMLPSPFGRSEPMPASSVSSAATPRPLISETPSTTPTSASPGPDSPTPDDPGAGQPTRLPAPQANGTGSGGTGGGGDQRDRTPSAGTGQVPGAGKQDKRTPSDGSHDSVAGVYRKVIEACRDYRAGRVQGERRRTLESKAGGAEKVEKFCDRVLGTSGSGGHHISFTPQSPLTPASPSSPTARPSASPTPSPPGSPSHGSGNGEAAGHIG